MRIGCRNCGKRFSFEENRTRLYGEADNGDSILLAQCPKCKALLVETILSDDIPGQNLRCVNGWFIPLAKTEEEDKHEDKM